jgi:hypothetical protein
MRPAVRLTRRQDGGFRLDAVAAAAIEAVPRREGFDFEAFERGRMTWDAAEPGWVLMAGDSEHELGRTTPLESTGATSPSSVLLADGRLFRLALTGASDVRFEIGRFDVPGAYAVGRSHDAGWNLERTAAGELLTVGPELWVLAAAEIGRLDGWW